MGILSKILGGGGIIDSIGGIVDKFHLSGEEKQKFKLEMEGLLQARDANVEETVRAQIQARERVLIAELQQGDTFTKRARPTVVYFGLFMIFLNYTVFPMMAARSGLEIMALELPTGFWAAWGGITSSWVIGRSAERMGHSGKILQWISGNGKKNKSQQEW